MPKHSHFVHFDLETCFSPQRRTILRHPNFEKCSEDYSFLTFSLPNVCFATAEVNFFELQKVLREQQFFNIFTSKCVFRHSGVHFFNILNFKKCSENDSFLIFSLPNMCFATAACIFSTSKLQKVLRERQFCNIFTAKYVFRHSGLHFFNIWTSKSALRTTVC